MTVSVEGVNQGVAPFYYPWPIELAQLDTTATPPFTVPAGSYALARVRVP